MMTKLREMTKIFIYIVSAAFIAMMVIQWGANFRGFRRVKDYAGIVDGEKIKISYYQKLYQQNLENLRKQGVNENILSTKAHEMTWNQILLNKVLEKVEKKYDLSITPEEVAFYTLNIPPDVLRNNPQLMTNGKFDIEKYKNIMKNNRNLFAQIYEYYKQQLPMLKVDEVLYDGVYASLPEGVDSYLSSNLTADIEYIYIPRLAFRQKPSTVSDEDARKYYETHKDEFKVEEQRQLKYVAFPIKVTHDDSIKTEKLVKEIERLLKEGEDFLELADIYSDETIQSTGKKGDMGYVDQEVYISTIPELKTAKIGDIIGPKKDGIGYKFYKVVDKKVEKVQGKKTRKVHLYSLQIAYKPSSETADLVREKATKFKELAEDMGFEEAAKKMGLEVKETQPFQRGRFITGIGIHKAIESFAFNNDEETISKVFTKTNPLNKNVYYVVKVAKIIPESIQPLDEVKNVCKARVEYENREKLMNKHADYIAKLIKENNDLMKAAKKDTAQIAKYNKVENHHPANPLTDIGLDNAFNYYSYYLADMNKIEGPVRGVRGVFFVKVLKRDSVKIKDSIADAKIRLNMILNNRRSSFIQKWLEEEKKKLEVKDYRYLFYSEL